MKILLAQHHNVRKKYLKGQGQNRSNLYINITPTKILTTHYLLSSVFFFNTRAIN